MAARAARRFLRPPLLSMIADDGAEVRPLNGARELISSHRQERLERHFAAQPIPGEATWGMPPNTVWRDEQAGSPGVQKQTHTSENTAMPNANELYDAAMELKEQGDLEGAVQNWQEILTIDPNHVLTHSALAVHLQKLGRNDEAISHALKVTELEPNDAFSYTQLSVVYQRCGRIPEAEEAKAKAHAVQMGMR